MVSISWPCDLPTSASQSPGMTGVSYSIQPRQCSSFLRFVILITSASPFVMWCTMFTVPEDWNMDFGVGKDSAYHTYLLDLCGAQIPGSQNSVGNICEGALKAKSTIQLWGVRLVLEVRINRCIVRSTNFGWKWMFLIIILLPLNIILVLIRILTHSFFS